MLKVFDRMGTKLPLVTRIMVAMFNTVRGNFLPILLGLVAAGVFMAMMRRIPKVRFWTDSFQTKVPLIGPLVIAGEMSRFSRTLAMLLESGVPLANALKLGRSGCKNLPLRRALLDAEESLLSGHGFAAALKQHAVIPTMFVEMVVIGEESNSLRRTMNDAATTYQKQLEQRLNGILGMLEPISTVIVGAIVALIAFSMFVPIYSSLNAFK